VPKILLYCTEYNRPTTVIDVCHKYVLHRFEGANGEHAWEVGIHCACVEIGEGGKSKHVMGSTDFFIRLETVNIVPSLDDGWLHRLGGLNALVVASHVAFISGCWMRQVIVDKMRHETGDCFMFPAMFEGLYKCSRRRRAQVLVYVACIFTHG
jgi:hypothetical protein